MSGMSIWEILLLGVGLSMDAFAVSICKGLSVKKVKWQHLLCVGAYFGIFQALMPTLGYFLGTTFSNLIDQFDHWVAFILLAIIGVNMVREALSKDEDETNDDFGFKTMLLLAIATSIDALAVGVTFALEGTDNRPRSLPDWSDDVHAFAHRSAGGQPLRAALQEQGGAGRRSGADWHRLEDSA